MRGVEQPEAQVGVGVGEAGFTGLPFCVRRSPVLTLSIQKLSLGGWRDALAAESISHTSEQPELSS